MDTQWHRQGDGWESSPPSGVLPLIIGPQVIQCYICISEKPMQALIVRYFWQSCPPSSGYAPAGTHKVSLRCIILLNLLALRHGTRYLYTWIGTFIFALMTTFAFCGLIPNFEVMFHAQALLQVSSMLIVRNMNSIISKRTENGFINIYFSFVE